MIIGVANKSGGIDGEIYKIFWFLIVYGVTLRYTTKV
jgi:hypothetical protein